MENIDVLFTPEIPSGKIEILQELIGKSITRIVKYSWDTFEEYLEYLNMCSITDQSLDFFFKFSNGWLSITFNDDSEYAFFSSEEINSIMIRLERMGELYHPDYKKEFNEVNSSVEVTQLSPEYHHYLNTPIVRINILTTGNLNIKEQQLPSEKGLEFIFGNQKRLILSHNLTQNSFVFSVLNDNRSIDQSTFIKCTIG